MYWDDFAALIRRNLAPDERVVFYGPSWAAYKPHNRVTMCSFSLARRLCIAREMIWTGRHDEDIIREAVVMNSIAWHNGEVPLESTPGMERVDDQGRTWLKWPVQGAKGAVREALRAAVLRPSRELDRFLGEDTKQYGYGIRWYV